ncbi:MAG: rhodanese-like domain-containing protein [Gemmatimonadaceae bacterium]
MWMVRRALISVALTLALPCAHAQTASPLLVTPQQLAKELKDPALVLLQVGPKEDYDAGHIPGARLVTMRDVATENKPGAPVLELPDEADLRGRLERLGISNNSRIVVIAGADWASPSTRVVWTLQTAGLGERTRWLDGGAIAWKAAGLPITNTAPPAATPGHLTLTADRSVVVDYAWVQTHKDTPKIRLIDARDAVFYEGVGMPEHNAKAGHIPGAKSLPFTSVMDDSLHVLPVTRLQQLFAGAGVQPGDTVVAYCHIGQQATALLFGARVLGHPIKLYDGSFTDWESRKLPVENNAPDKKPGDR